MLTTRAEIPFVDNIPATSTLVCNIAPVEISVTASPSRTWIARPSWKLMFDA
jgi:hypothetical protein